MISAVLCWMSLFLNDEPNRCMMRNECTASLYSKFMKTAEARARKIIPKYELLILIATMNVSVTFRYSVRFSSLGPQPARGYTFLHGVYSPAYSGTQSTEETFAFFPQLNHSYCNADACVLSIENALLFYVSGDLLK